MVISDASSIMVIYFEHNYVQNRLTLYQTHLDQTVLKADNF